MALRMDNGQWTSRTRHHVCVLLLTFDDRSHRDPHLQHDNDDDDVQPNCATHNSLPTVAWWWLHSIHISLVVARRQPSRMLSVSLIYIKFSSDSFLRHICAGLVCCTIITEVLLLKSTYIPSSYHTRWWANVDRYCWNENVKWLGLVGWMLVQAKWQSKELFKSFTFVRLEWGLICWGVWLWMEQ